MKKSKRSPKKIDFVNVAFLTLNAVEYQAKNLAHSYKGWQENWTLLIQNVEKIEKAIKNDIGIKPTELNQEYSDSNAKVLKLTKEIEAAQKLLHKSQSAFKTKLQDPFVAAGGNHNLPKQEEIQASIQKIQETLDVDKKRLNEISGKYQALILRFVSLESGVRKYCLTDHMEEMVKINDRFNKCAEALCQETVELGAGPNPKQFSPTEIKSTFLLLFNAHLKAGQLLQQIQKNLGPMPDLNIHSSGPAAAGSQ